MQTEGTLSKWNEGKGYGFITPQRGGQDVFVHISAFPKDGARPTLREKLAFTIAIDPNGKKRAVEVQRLASKQAASRPAPRKSGNSTVILASTALLAATLFYGYTAFYKEQPAPSSTAPLTAAPATPVSTTATASTSTFRCDGRTHCSQMNSCEEAKFFLRNCPNVQMDGNGDGVPCEQQWCGR